MEKYSCDDVGRGADLSEEDFYTSTRLLLHEKDGNVEHDDHLGVEEGDVEGVAEGVDFGEESKVTWWIARLMVCVLLQLVLAKGTQNIIFL